MKRVLILMFAVCLAVSCGRASKETQSKPDESPEKATADLRTSQDGSTKKDTKNQDSPAIGTYTGSFEAVEFDDKKDYVYKNRITISIDSLGEDTINGHSVVAGNDRLFSGKYKMDGKTFKVEAAEPGDDKYDGRFSFTVDPDAKTVTGTWSANDGKLAVTKRKYTLTKKQFKYDASLKLPEDVQWAQLYGTNPKFPDQIESLTDEVTKINASVKELTAKDIENMFKGDLEIIRNTIYARHGYSFKNRRVRFIFDQFVPWYMPLKTDIRNDLTDLEKKNIDLLKRYEEHADRYYDEFGR